LTPIDRGRVAMRYWNADGGEVEMCGNGVRCLAVLSVVDGLVDGKSFIVESAVGDHPVTVLDNGMVRAFVGQPHPFRTEEITVAGHTVRPVGVGNPHAVLIVDDVSKVEVSEIGPQIERDPLFPEGVNVEFVRALGDGSIQQRTHERGSGETLACGSGATVAALAAMVSGRVPGPQVVVHLRGGVLTIRREASALVMEGPARTVFAGEFPIPES